MPLLSCDKLDAALSSGADIKVMHTSQKDNGTTEDHVWSLSDQDKTTLRKAMAAGLA
jgi:hypothetical protein